MENEKKEYKKENIKIQNNIINNINLNNNNINENKEEFPYSTERMEKLKRKEKEKWAIQVKIDDENYIKEEKEQKEKIV